MRILEDDNSRYSSVCSARVLITCSAVPTASAPAKNLFGGPIVAPDSGLELQKKRSATYENFRYLKSCFHFQRLAPQPLKASISVLRIYLLGYRAFRKIRELFLRIQVVSNYWLSQLFQSNTNYIINSVQKIQQDNFFEHLL
jgi:hypothetical protein